MDKYSAEAWTSASFLEKLDWATREVSQNGPRITEAILAHHWLRAIFQNAIFGLLLYSLPTAGLDARESLWRTWVRYTAWTHLFESLGFRHGPLWGRFSPGPWGVFTNAYYRLTTGTLKFSLFPPRFVKRNVFDVFFHMVFYIAACLLAIVPNAPNCLVNITAAGATWVFLFDHQQWVAGHGPTYSLILATGCIPAAAGGLACAQSHVMLVWIGCGLGKVGPWFVFVNGPFMTASICFRGRKWFWRLAVQGENNLRPTFVMGAVSSLAAHIEWCAPLLLLTAVPATIRLGVLTMVAMHAYINLAPAIYDVYAWNFWFMAAAPIMFGGGPALSLGVDFVGLAAAPKWLLLWVVLEFVYVWYGLICPQNSPYNANHRHWAGNWPNGLFLVHKSAADKLMEAWNVPGQPHWSPPPERTRAFLAKVGRGVEDYELRMFKILGHFWNVSLNMKFMPTLVQKALDGRSIGDFYILHVGQFADLFMGGPNWNHRIPELTVTVGEPTDLKVGDCICIWTGPFPFRCGRFHGSHSWKIVDAKAGVVAEGEVTMERAWALCGLPSDTERGEALLSS